MKKRSIKNLSLGKRTISIVTNNMFGGSPTTNQSQHCPKPIQLPDTIPLPLPDNHTTVVTLLSFRTNCPSICEC